MHQVEQPRRGAAAAAGICAVVGHHEWKLTIRAVGCLSVRSCSLSVRGTLRKRVQEDPRKVPLARGQTPGGARLKNEVEKYFFTKYAPRPAAFIRSGSERKIHNRETGPAIVSRLPTIWPPAVNAFENNATECQACRFRMRSCPHVPFRIDGSRSRYSMVDYFFTKPASFIRSGSE